MFTPIIIFTNEINVAPTGHGTNGTRGATDKKQSLKMNEVNGLIIKYLISYVLKYIGLKLQ
jgi:hypothetical protein